MELTSLTKLQAVGLQFYQKYASLQVFFKIFARICSTVIYKKFFEILRTFYLPENLLVAAANRCKILKILISIKFTVYIQDRRQRSEKILDA